MSTDTTFIPNEDENNLSRLLKNSLNHPHNPLHCQEVGNIYIWGTPPDPYQRGKTPLNSPFHHPVRDRFKVLLADNEVLRRARWLLFYKRILYLAQVFREHRENQNSDWNKYQSPTRGDTGN